MIGSPNLNWTDASAIGGSFTFLVVAQWYWLRAKFEDLSEAVKEVRVKQDQWLSIREYEKRTETIEARLDEFKNDLNSLWSALRTGQVK